MRVANHIPVECPLPLTVTTVNHVTNTEGIGPQGSECVAPSKYIDGVFIASPQNMTKELIAKVKHDVSGSKVVAYWDFGEIPIMGRTQEECPFCKGHIMGDRPGRNCSTTYVVAVLSETFLAQGVVNSLM
jgi:hypothetical protein